MSIRNRVTPLAILILFLVCNTCASVAAEAYKRPVVAVGSNGLPVQLIWSIGPAKGILASPCLLYIQTDKGKFPIPAMRRMGSNEWMADLPAQHYKVKAAYSKVDASILLTVENLAQVSRTASLDLVLPVRPDADRAFFPARSDSHAYLPAGGRTPVYAYGVLSKDYIECNGLQLPQDAADTIGMALPLGSVYSAGADWGLALFGDHSYPISEFALTVARTKKSTNVTVMLRNIECKPGEKVVRRLYLAATEGDWRPALAAVLAQFPQVFKPQNKSVAALKAPFVNSVRLPVERVDDWAAQGVKAVEIHCTFPFYGKYVPDGDGLFTDLVDDNWYYWKQGYHKQNDPYRERLKNLQLPPENPSWRVIRDFMEQLEPPTISVDGVRNYIDLLHKHGIKSFIYWEGTAAWKAWALEQFPNDRLLKADGTTQNTWLEECVMIPDKNRPWGRYILDQLDTLLTTTYPDIDGVFFDQMAEGGHDLTELSAEACRMIRAKGKICWWNGPYNAELATLADAMMCEAAADDSYRPYIENIQYYGLAGKPIVSLGGQHTTEAYCRLLLRGIIWPPIRSTFASLQVESKDIAERWSPLFQQMQKSSGWVLEAHALQTSPDIASNIFKTSDGNYIAPIIVPSAGERPNRNFRFGVNVKIKVRDYSKVRAVYLLTPDLPGMRKLAFKINRGTIEMTIPRLRDAGMLVLAKTGVFASIDGDTGMGVVCGSKSRIRLVVDNWTGKAISASMGINCGSEDISEKKQVLPGKTAQTSIIVSIPANPAGDRIALKTTAEVGGVNYGSAAELWCEPPTILQVQAPASMLDNQSIELRVAFLNHLKMRGTAVQIKPSSSSFVFAPSWRTVDVSAGIPVTAMFTAKPKAGGKSTIQVVASASDVNAAGEAVVDVIALSMPPDGYKEIESAELILDDFGSGGGDYANKTIKLNGMVVGPVPQDWTDAWSCDRHLPIPPSALAAIRESNEITIDNPVKDFFKVRNLRLIIKMRGDITVHSQVDAGVYTGGAGWANSEGKEFPLGQPITGIVITVPVK